MHPSSVVLNDVDALRTPFLCLVAKAPQGNCLFVMKCTRVPIRGNAETEASDEPDVTSENGASSKA